MLHCHFLLIYYIFAVFTYKFVCLKIFQKACISMDSEIKLSNCTHPSNCLNHVYCDDKVSPCFSLYLQNNSAVNQTILPHTSGCWYQNEDEFLYEKECYLKHQATKHGFSSYICLCTGHLCNANVIFNQTLMKKKPTVKPRTKQQSTVAQSKKVQHNNKKIFFIIFPSFGFVTIIGILIFVWRYKRIVELNQTNLLQLRTPPSPPIATKSIKFYEAISNGEFGHIWKAFYENKIVTVKKILASQKDLWETERNIFLSYKLNHENILNFYAAEKRFENNHIQYWIITEFHPHGSLTNFLTLNIIDFKTLLSLSLSIANGLSYLHECLRKPSIAHRDFKSGNVLVKDNLTCCICGFGSSFAFVNDADNEKARFQIGTNQYMAPEVLEGAITFQTESFLQIDIYALGLVLWEILSRCDGTEAPVKDYQVPYQNIVGLHPSIDDMVKCVCVCKVRPVLRSEWWRHPVFKDLCETIEECWEMDPGARLSAQRVSVRITDLLKAC